MPKKAYIIQDHSIARTMPIIVYITHIDLLAITMPKKHYITLAHFFYLARGSTKPHDTAKATQDKNCPPDLTRATNGLHYSIIKKQSEKT
jgi:hypothetical protein